VNSVNGLVGVGCFAGEETLSRVLRRMIESCSPGEVAGSLRVWPEASGGSRMLRDLMAGREPCNKRRVAGFFLSFKDRKINLSVFTRVGGLKCEKFTASLEKG
jgi:hypothetical protein